MNHPYFGMVHKCHNRTDIGICYRSAVPVTAYKGDTVFGCGDHSFRAMFVTKGHLRYNFMGQEESISNSEICISEASIWTKWDHKGSLVAEDTSVLVSIVVTEFSAVVQEHVNAYVDTVSYARDFIQQLKVYEGQLSDLAAIYTRKRPSEMVRHRIFGGRGRRKALPTFDPNLDVPDSEDNPGLDSKVAKPCVAEVHTFTPSLDIPESEDTFEEDSKVAKPCFHRATTPIGDAPLLRESAVAETVSPQPNCVFVNCS